jgi:hypothetical protein
LSERLEAARREREGVPPSEADDLVVIPEPLAPGPRSDFGEPGRCLQCNARSEVDYIDLVRARMMQHCLSCGFEWTLDRDGSLVD